ncbi:uncharacterized protein LOC134095302 [Sardina pilchardus]|uniref:uncharacterized protein LOC134095302 n=1 Tax=Sardina pilchardus TaxID=27697 RepID=UPI002E11B2CE
MQLWTLRSKDSTNAWEQICRRIFCHGSCARQAKRRITVDHQRRHEKNGAQEKIQRDNEKRKPQLNGSSDVNIQRAVARRGLPFYLHEDDGTFIKTWDGSSDVNIPHTVALSGLPFYLHEDDGTFIKTWDVSQSEFKMRKPSPICRRLDLALQAGILHIYLFCFRSTFAGTNRILAYPSDAPGSWSDWLKDYPSVQRHLNYANSSRLLSSRNTAQTPQTNVQSQKTELGDSQATNSNVFVMYSLIVP